MAVVWMFPVGLRLPPGCHVLAWVGFYDIYEKCKTTLTSEISVLCQNVTPEPIGSQENTQKKQDLSSVDNDHLEASDRGVDICEWQAGLQHLCSHHAGDEGDFLLHSSSWTQWGHPARRQDIKEFTKCTTTTALDQFGLWQRSSILLYYC